MASPNEPESFDTPEAAALAGWEATSRTTPRVISVDIRGDRAEVLIEEGASHPDYVYCYRVANGWHEATSGNGPSKGWDDPTYLIWPDSP
jgi:hypothetical protein